MELNDCNCYIGGYETFEANSKKGFGFIRVHIGEEGGKWGYSVGFMGFIGGKFYPLTPDSLIYATRSEAVNAAIKEVKTIHCDNTGTLPSVVQEVIDQLSDSTQFGLFD